MIDVLVVDDSAFMRKVLSDGLNEDPEINVVDSAGGGKEAVEKTELLRPDVVTMDVEMPGMDGIKAVREIMKRQPTSIVMVSAYTRRGAEKTIQALEAGAIDFVEKPGGTISLNIKDVQEEIIKKVKIASKANLKGTKKKIGPIQIHKTGEKTLIIIAASTGGPKAITLLFKRLPQDFTSSIIVVQHMPQGFTKAFAKRLDEHSSITVREAKDGDSLKNGEALIAPGDFHLEIGKDERVKLNKRPPLHGVRPSADITMNSASDVFNGDIIGIVLSGMGKDGSIGIRNIKRRGGTIISQDEETAVVYGMPKAALDSKCVDYVLPIEEIADKLVEMVKKNV